MENDINKRPVPEQPTEPGSAEHKPLTSGDTQHQGSGSSKEVDGRELIKNIDTLEEYNDLTTSYGHDPDEPQDHTNTDEPQDRDKRFHVEHKKPETPTSPEAERDKDNPERYNTD